MSRSETAQLVKKEIDRSDPATTLNELIKDLDADPEEIFKAVEQLQNKDEIQDDILLWRGGDQRLSD